MLQSCLGSRRALPILYLHILFFLLVFPNLSCFNLLVYYFEIIIILLLDLSYLPITLPFYFLPHSTLLSPYPSSLFSLSVCHLLFLCLFVCVSMCLLIFLFTHTKIKELYASVVVVDASVVMVVEVVVVVELMLKTQPAVDTGGFGGRTGGE